MPRKSVSTHIKRRRAGVVINVNTLNKRYSINPCRHPSTWCNSHFFPTHRSVAEEDVAAAEDAAVEATHQTQSSNNLLNDTQQSVLPPPQPGIRPKTLSESHWDYPQVCAQLNGNKSLSASTLQERVKTPCVQSLQEREKTPCVQSQSVFIPDQHFKLSSQEPEVIPVGGRLRRFLPKWEKQKAHQSILSLIQDGYKLPFRQRPK